MVTKSKTSRQRVIDHGEVFTPPSIVTEMLDLVTEECERIASRFLEPACGDGNFLAEVLSRKLSAVDAIHRTNCTKWERQALLAVSSLYGIELLADNVTACRARLQRLMQVKYQERWNVQVSPAFQQAVRRTLAQNIFQGDALTIHQDLPPGRFEVIVGNPPYQRNDGGYGRSAVPIYQHFVSLAKRLTPRYLLMITPARWYGGGKGLDGFRAEMLSDNRIRRLVDFENARDAFPEIDIAGGVCYFLWDRDYRGMCRVTHRHGSSSETCERKLDEFDTFIRHAMAATIARKVAAIPGQRMHTQVSSRKPFGLATTVRPQVSGELNLRWQKGEGPFPREQIKVGDEMIDRWKVITTYVAHDHAGNPNREGRRRVLSKIDILPPGTICNETYLVIGHYGSREEANNLVAYMKTRFFRFLLSLQMYSHHLTRVAYNMVPVLDMNVLWTDDTLAKKYGLSSAETAFMNSKIREHERRQRHE